ncbi:hypothetical protein NO559_02580 [Dasania sp. GY-MA-18]|uniref:Uncharacterized protein n=1 Tax=Dasania phycosphaerae TaxID=2950436 RepID=A0A9J6RI08_9GAMM|nr:MULTISPECIES: hypothetical protein [Dasania]MCR8921640.1 hypothetical protein [Dasania sp. GY-MA-18]MCZ0864068.1 hypothetical protein [Dasania phycosphaerae]MCZ0867796.1 hypothetical protein [Dasania phycosphaerae]
MLCSIAAYAAPTKIFIALDQWDSYSSKEGAGYCLELMKEVPEPAGVAVSFKIVPYRRSVEMVSTNKADVMLGAYSCEKIEGAFVSFP